MLERFKTTAGHFVKSARSGLATFLTFIGREGPTIITFIGAILAIVGVVIDIELEPPIPVSLRYVGVIGASLAAFGALLSSFQAARREEDLKEKNKTIISLQGRLHDSVTGGDDFARIVSPGPEISVMGPERNSLYDITIQYTDTALKREHGFPEGASPYPDILEGAPSPVGTAPYHRYFRIDFLHPNSEFRVIREIESKEMTIPFIITAKFTARNGQWHQVMILDADVESGSVGTATVVMRDGKILWKYVQSGYPYKDKFFRRFRDEEA